MLTMSSAQVNGRTRSQTVRPALVTVIAALEVAAALWDGYIFLSERSLSAIGLGNPWALHMLMPALMCIAAIYGGVGLLQMRREAWTVWMVRHAWLAVLYALSLPALLYNSLWCPALSAWITWQASILFFSFLAGGYLLGVRHLFGVKSAR